MLMPSATNTPALPSNVTERHITTLITSAYIILFVVLLPMVEISELSYQSKTGCCKSISKLWQIWAKLKMITVKLLTKTIHAGSPEKISVMIVVIKIAPTVNIALKQSFASTCVRYETGEVFAM